MIWGRSWRAMAVRTYGLCSSLFSPAYVLDGPDNSARPTFLFRCPIFRAYRKWGQHLSLLARMLRFVGEARRIPK
eukprot:1055181-Amphidinium_carterae.2